MGRSSIKHDEGNPYCKCFTCFIGITDGKPSVYEEFMAQSENGAWGEATEESVDGDGSLGRSIIVRMSFAHNKPLTEQPLEVRVAKDIESLTAGLDDFKGEKELPKKEFTIFDASYADAYDAAIKNCVHANVQNLLYNKEWYCEDCGKHFNQAEYKNIMSRRGPFGFFTM